MRAPKIETEIRREQIIEAAFELVGSHGLNGLTMEKIASVIGVVPSALYKHFKNKQQILFSILEMIQGRLVQLLEIAREKGKTPLGKIHLFFLGETRFLRQNPEGPMVFISSLARHGRTSKRMIGAMKFGQTMYREITALLREGQDKGEVRTDLPAETMGFFYFAMVQQVGMVKNLGGDMVDIIKHMDYAWKAFLDMVQPR